MTDIPDAEWDFYESFYTLRVLPKVSRDMNDCEGFYSWLLEHDPALYNRIEAAEKELNSLWLNRAEHKSFKAACKSWYDLLMEAKKGFDTGKAKKREEALLAGRQEAMTLR